MSGNEDLVGDKEVVVEEKMLVLQSKEIDIAATIKAYQCIYDQITGKPQKLTKSFRHFYEIDFPKFDQMNIKINQLLKTYNVISRNCIISVFHDGNDKEDYPSYELFSNYNISNTAPVVGLAFNYNFTILNQSEKRVQNYSLSVKFTPSGQRMLGVPARYRFLSRFEPTISIEIEYTDYVVARTVLGILSEWAESTKIKQNQKLIDFADNLIGLLPKVFLSLFVILEFIIASMYISNTELSVNSFAIFILKIGLISFFGISLLNELGENLPSYIYSIFDSPRIMLNEGNKNQKTEYQENRKKGLVKSFLFFCGNILINIIAAGICKYWLKI